MAHTREEPLTDRPSQTEKYEVAPVALALNDSLLAICLAYGNVPPILSSFYMSQNLIQAVPPMGSPLLQLPYMTPKITQAVEGPGSKVRYSVQKFMRMSDDERRRLAVGPGLLTEEQYQVATSMARQIPHLKVEAAYFKVMGERFVTPSSLVQFVVKARVIPPGTTSVPELSIAELDDVDPEEGDIEAMLGRKSGGVGRKGQAKMLDAAASPDEDNAVQPPLAFAPYFARDHSPRWHIFLSDSKQGKMAVPPFTFTSLAKPIFDEQGKPTLALQTLKMQFQAPPQAGQYTFVMYLVCDSYIGTDTKMEVTMEVEEMGRAEEMVGEDEISEPDEGEFSCFLFSFFLPERIPTLAFIFLLSIGIAIIHLLPHQTPHQTTPFLPSQKKRTPYLLSSEKQCTNKIQYIKLDSLAGQMSALRKGSSGGGGGGVASKSKKTNRTRRQIGAKSKDAKSSTDDAKAKAKAADAKENKAEVKEDEEEEVDEEDDDDDDESNTEGEEEDTSATDTDTDTDGE